MDKENTKQIIETDKMSALVEQFLSLGKQNKDNDDNDKKDKEETNIPSINSRVIIRKTWFAKISNYYKDDVFIKTNEGGSICSWNSR